MLERDVLKQVREYLKWNGWYVIRIQQGLGCHRGISDLICIKDGRTIFLEVKAENGPLSAFQERFRDEVAAHGGHYLMVNSLDALIKKL